MERVYDQELYEEMQAFLEPGEIELNGVIAHTTFDSSEEVQMMEMTIKIGDSIAAHAGFKPGDCYIYSGNDDPDFSTNQHQGRTLDNDEFVWECQNLLREGTFDIVFYYGASADQENIISDIEDLGVEITSIETS